MPLNPSASSYEPRFLPSIAEHHHPQDKFYMPDQFPLESHHVHEAFLLPPQVPEPPPGMGFPVVYPQFYPRPSFAYCSPWSWHNKEESLNLYVPENHPHPWNEVFNGPNSVSYDGICYEPERIVGEKKKVTHKRGLIPPRLKQPREYPIQRKKVWVRKEEAQTIRASSDVHGDAVSLFPPLTGEEQKKFEGKTSVMIKNVPNHFQRVDLQCMLDYHCRTQNRKVEPGSNFCKSAYDFLYLPMDFRFHLNLGFAFVNFTSPDGAVRLYRAFNNRKWSCADGRKKICEIGIAKFQGKDTLKEQLQKSSFPCHTNEYLPVVYYPPRDGVNHSRPTLLGRRTHLTATSKDEKVMIMTKRKNKKV
ncbi:hypothetical protein REPUB_Repub02eG0094800 [Reevesia pubescens]